jgi:hypothetical protein
VQTIGQPKDCDKRLYFLIIAEVVLLICGFAASGKLAPRPSRRDAKAAPLRGMKRERLPAETLFSLTIRAVHVIVNFEEALAGTRAQIGDGA